MRGSGFQLGDIKQAFAKKPRPRSLIVQSISPSTSQYRQYRHYRQRPRNTFIIDVRQGGVTLRSLAPRGVARECVSTRTPYVCTSCQASEGLGRPWLASWPEYPSSWRHNIYADFSHDGFSCDCDRRICVSVSSHCLSSRPSTQSTEFLPSSSERI